jgi:hypothetical protein
VPHVYGAIRKRLMEIKTMDKAKFEYKEDEMEADK